MSEDAIRRHCGAFDRLQSLHHLGECLGLFFPEIRESFDAVGVFAGEVVLLGAVVGEVVKFPVVIAQGDEFPIADTRGAIAFVQPPQALAFDGGIIGKCCDEAFPWCWRHGSALPFLRFGHACKLKDGRHDIDDVGRRVAQSVLRFDQSRPVHDERRADAAFMHP